MQTISSFDQFIFEIQSESRDQTDHIQCLFSQEQTFFQIMDLRKNAKDNIDDYYKTNSVKIKHQTF